MKWLKNVVGGMIIRKHRLLLALAVLLSGSITGCSSQQSVEPLTPSATDTISNTSPSIEQKTAGEISSGFPTTALAASIVIDSVNEEPSIRAEQQTDQGTLLMISNGREERGHLNVSSTLGQEGDQTFQSNYSVIYRQGEEDQVLLELPALLFVQPTDKKLPFEHVSFKDADVYILTPQYKTGHGVEGYVFAVDKDSGDAFPLEVVKNGRVHKTILYSEGELLPAVEDDTLIVHPPVGAGTPEEDAKDKHYTLDLTNKQLTERGSND
ncbi:hypothetical protein [Paenibacillus lemnae]|uniref:Lipoprotein n=1 Tax=Paenibacillus lemnae TaxID=1330551 RepID=A0A848MAP1_PAELE|nr:hypothetical protein [Paenibacillus lemnae]NMO97142.1 hypothetical protein [Paenibacillus lemnae]